MTAEDARDLQSELRKLDRSLKDLDVNVKKYEKLLLSCSSQSRLDDSTAVACAQSLCLLFVSHSRY